MHKWQRGGKTANQKYKIKPDTTVGHWAWSHWRMLGISLEHACWGARKQGPLVHHSLQSLVEGCSWRVLILKHFQPVCLQAEQVPANSNALRLLEFSPASSTKVKPQGYGWGHQPCLLELPDSHLHLQLPPKFQTEIPQLGLISSNWTFLGPSNSVRSYQTSHPSLLHRRPTPAAIMSDSPRSSMCPDWTNCPFHIFTLSPSVYPPITQCHRGTSNFTCRRTSIQIVALALPHPSCTHTGTLPPLSELLRCHP